MKTELIASWRLVNVAGRDMYVVTTLSGAEIWIPKTQFDTNSETVTYELQVAGTEYTKKDNTVAKTVKDQLVFKGCGKQIIKKFSSMDLVDRCLAAGIAPTFSMS